VGDYLGIRLSTAPDTHTKRWVGSSGGIVSHEVKGDGVADVAASWRGICRYGNRDLSCEFDVDDGEQLEGQVPVHVVVVPFVVINTVIAVVTPGALVISCFLGAGVGGYRRRK
jgi:hypothetical protein